MYKDYKIVVNTAAGRRRYMQYLIPFVVTCDIVDRYDLWLNTMNRQDIAFFKCMAEKFPKINLVWQPDGIVNGNSTINAFYKGCVEEKTIYFKLDDDIIWMEDTFIEKMVAFRIENPQYFVVSPLVINNALSTYLLQVYNKIKLDSYYMSYCFEKTLWENAGFATELHNWFLYEYLVKNKVSSLYIGKHPMGMIRFSINAILWFGDEMKKFSGEVEGDDEEFLSCLYPSKHGLLNCWNGDAICSHFAFFSQRQQLDKEKVLDKYGKIIREGWKTSDKYAPIVSIIDEAMDYVETQKNNLPDAPYKEVIVKKTKVGLRERFKNLLPHAVYLRVMDKNIKNNGFIRR